MEGKYAGGGDRCHPEPLPRRQLQHRNNGGDYGNLAIAFAVSAFDISKLPVVTSRSFPLAAASTVTNPVPSTSFLMAGTPSPSIGSIMILMPPKDVPYLVRHWAISAELATWGMPGARSRLTTGRSCSLVASRLQVVCAP